MNGRRFSQRRDVRARRRSRRSNKRPPVHCASAWEASMDDWSSIRLCDVVNLSLSVVLFFSPWLFDLSAGAQWQTASIIGIVIAVLSIAALAAFAIWEEWLNLVAGLALIASPWLLGFQDSQAMTIDVVIGIIVAALAAFEAWLCRRQDSELRSQKLEI
jgi:hypothetical protein